MWARENIEAMFSGIASRYDRCNRFLSFNMVEGWRRALVDAAGPDNGAQVLDLCTGTGDICVEFAGRPGTGKIIGVDFSREMLSRAQAKLSRMGLGGKVKLVKADALALPFGANSFDIVTVGFGLRNFVDRRKGLEAIKTVLSDGGRAVILEAVAPGRSLFGLMYGFYLRYILPAVAWVVGDHIDGYRYFADSVRGFVGPREIVEWLSATGFVNIRCKKLSAGIAFLFYGEKPRR